MRIVVIGGTGLVGSKLVHALTERGHEAVGASPRTGVNAVTGAGLPEVLAGASVVVDVSNSPSFEDDAAMEFFNKSTTNLLAAEAEAGVSHHVALSVVGTDFLARHSGYFKAKLTQEELISAGPIPFSIVRATQFFEFLRTIADSATVDHTVRLPSAFIQPVSSADLAESIATVAVTDPVNGMTEVGGPERFRLPDLIRTALTARGDAREVIADPAAPYWGIPVDEGTLVPSDGATLSETRFADWILEVAATGRDAGQDASI
ncbi:SDR family oxidoreductase [Mycolicibacterium boenickei]